MSDVQEPDYQMPGAFQSLAMSKSDSDANFGDEIDDNPHFNRSTTVIRQVGFPDYFKETSRSCQEMKGYHHPYW